jgi:hypothetical protein
MAILGQVAPFSPDYEPTLEEQLSVLGQAPPAPAPAPAPAAPEGRTGLDYATFGLASALGRAMNYEGALAGQAQRGYDIAHGNAPAPVAAPAAAPVAPAAQGTGLGVLPLSSLPQSPTGIGAQYGLPAAAPAPSAAPTTTAAPTTAATPQAAPKGAQGQRAAGPAKLSEIGQIQEGVAGARLDTAREALDTAIGRAGTMEASTIEAQKAESVAAAQRAELAGEEADLARQREEEAATEREARRQAAEQAAAKLEAAQTELDGTKIDIDKAYGGAAGRIFAGLAVALGSFGASMSGGPNYALNIVDQRINRELDAQKTEIDKKKGKVSELGRLLQQNENLLGDATAARKLARAQTYTALAADIEARSKGAALGPQQQQALATLRANAANEMAGLQESVTTAAAEKALVGARERQSQRAAAALEAARQRKRRESIEDQLTIESGKKQINAMFPDPETAAKITGRATAMAKDFDEKGLATGPGLFQNIMRKIGVDPITGAVDPNAKVPGYTFGRATPGATLVDSDARELARLNGEVVELVAKASGGVVTGGDREGALNRLRGAGTLQELQSAIKDFYGNYAAKTKLFASADPQAFDVLASANPQLAALTKFGATSQAAAAAGLRPVGK